MVTTSPAPRNIFECSLTEAIESVEASIAELEVTLLLGEMWTQKKSDVSYSVSATLGRLSYLHKRQMVALSQLQYWTANNGYATTLTVRKLLTSWCAGSVMLMELIDIGFQAAYWDNQLEYFAPEMMAEVADMYPPG